jgi:hypothetical protein
MRTHELQHPMSRFQQRLQEIEAEGARSKSARIAELLPEIEAALAKGFSRAHVVDALKAEGLELTPSLLSSYLQRFRQRLRAGSPLSRQTPLSPDARPSLPDPAAASATPSPDNVPGNEPDAG